MSPRQPSRLQHVSIPSRLRMFTQDRTSTFRLPRGLRADLRYASTASTSSMVLNPESKYPNRRAYVLKLRGDATPEALAGRLENMVTGRQLDFASADELLESIARDLRVRTDECLADPTTPEAA